MRGEDRESQTEKESDEMHDSKQVTDEQIKQAIAGCLDEHVATVDQSYATAIRDAMLAVGRVFHG